MPAVTRLLGQPRVELQSTTSTMDEVRKRQPDAPEGLTVVAQTQTSGRGRGDHRWEDIPGSSLLFSTLLRPGVPFERFQLFPSAAGLAVAEAVDQLLMISVQLKWPNDLFIAGLKLGGVLVTSRVRAGEVETAVIGVGINLLRVPAGFGRTATSLSTHISGPIERETLLDNILVKLSEVYSLVLSGDTDDLVASWNHRCLWRGEIVSIETADGVKTGRLLGIDESGSVRIEQDSGDTVGVAFGELTRGVRLLGQTA